MRLLLDTNIILDVLEYREPHYATSARILRLCEQRAVTGYISTLTFANIVYIMRKNLDAVKILQIYGALNEFLYIVDTTNDDVKNAADLKWTDFEDAVQSVIAERIGVTYIVTRNTKDYVDSNVSSISPREFCEAVLGDVATNT